MLIDGGGTSYSSFAEELQATIAEKNAQGEPVEVTPQEIMTRVLRDELFDQCMPSNEPPGSEDRVARHCFEKAQNRIAGLTAEEIKERFDVQGIDVQGVAAAGLRIRARKFLNNGRDIFEIPSSRDCSYTHRLYARDSEDGLRCGMEGFCGDEFVWRIESAEYCYQAFGCVAPPIGGRP